MWALETRQERKQEQTETQLATRTEWTGTDQATKTVETDQVETDQVEANQVAETVKTVQEETDWGPVYTHGPYDQAVYSAGTGPRADRPEVNDQVDDK